MSSLYNWFLVAYQLEMAYKTLVSCIKAEMFLKLWWILLVVCMWSCEQQSNMSIVFYSPKKKNLQRLAVFNALLKCTKPASLWDLYAFVSGPSKFNNTNPKVRLLNEYLRLLGKGSLRASMNMIEDGSFTFSNDLWRISSINSSYTMCQSYPFALIVPKSIT